MALTKAKADGLTADLIDETKLADNSIDSEHYNDGSIDNAHLADDAVGVAELSATGTASSSTFLRGDNSWVTPTDTNTQLAFANDANNRVVTGDGSGGLNGEANLTFDGNNLDVSGGCITTFGGNTTHESASIKVGYEGSSKGQIRVYGADASTTGSLEFNVCEGDGTDEHTVLIDGSGNLKVSDGDLVIGTSGHGIDFSAQTASSSGTTGAELLDHYEEGSFSPTAAEGTFTTSNATYTRIGRSVTYQIYGSFSSNSSGNAQSLTNFPFAAVAGTYYSCAVNSNTGSSSHPVGQFGANTGLLVFKDTSNNAFNGGDMSSHFVVLSGVYETT